MISVLAGIRYAFFALYIICSGVLVTAASWHIGLANSVGASAQLDVYLVFLGAFGLLFVLAVAFIDTMRKYAVTSTVWFELGWIGLFWVFYLAAASASTALGPPEFCQVSVSTNLLGWRDACTAVKVILAFTWIGTILFLAHLFTLLVLSVLHAPQAPGVWHSGVRDFPWLDFATRPSFRNSVSANGGVRMGSEPSSPTKYHYERRMAAAQPIAAPVSVQPAAPIYEAMTSHAVYPSHTPEHYPTHPYAAAAVSRPAPVHNVEASLPYQYRPERDHRAKTQSQAIIEQFRAGQLGKDSTSQKPAPGQVQSTIVRALPQIPSSNEVVSPRPRRANAGVTEEQVMGASQPIRKLPEVQTSSNSRSYQPSQPPSLYPMQVQSVMEHATPTVSYSHEPQPLGDWPRRNPPSDPRRERNAAPPPFQRIPATIPSAGPMTASGARERVTRRMDSTDSGNSSEGSLDSDGAPRRKDGRPKHRPPPLDFSKLNAGRR
ncbi:unnamed protein product [Rhizoctonia solani]|uniref:MARVEL domain-containing protein n=1 Tax=Rhizoctonia solani TaxID=456999 RepID=A0A8H3HJ86_9AGAM|nr:unnamed protein product [Rhizoctonia solani]